MHRSFWSCMSLNTPPSSLVESSLDPALQSSTRHRVGTKFGLTALVLALGLFTLASCAHRALLVKNPEDILAYLNLIEAHNKRIEQVKASLDIRAYGVMAGFVHEQADIVVRTPHYIYWSIRSFFGPPSMILASNGEYLTAFDFTGQSASTYQKTPLHSDTFFELMDFRLHPASIVQLFLLKIPLEGSENIRLNKMGNKLEILADLKNGWKLRSIFDCAKLILLESELKNDALFTSYQAKYLNFEPISGIYFPKSIVLLAKGKSRSAKLNIEFSQTQLNGALVLPDVFYVKPH